MSEVGERLVVGEEGLENKDPSLREEGRLAALVVGV